MGTPRASLAERFHSKYEQGQPDECWEWTASRNSSGYGQLYDNRFKRPIVAHRIAYELAYKDHPGDFFVLYKCDNPPCVNPLHLHLGTQAENMAEAADRGRMPGNPNPDPPPVHRGDDSHKSKLTSKQVRLIRRLYDGGVLSQYQLATLTGVTRANIGTIVNRKSWRHV